MSRESAPGQLLFCRRCSQHVRLTPGVVRCPFCDAAPPRRGRFRGALLAASLLGLSVGAGCGAATTAPADPLSNQAADAQPETPSEPGRADDAGEPREEDAADPEARPGDPPDEEGDEPSDGSHPEPTLEDRVLAGKQFMVMRCQPTISALYGHPPPPRPTVPTTEYESVVGDVELGDVHHVWVQVPTGADAYAGGLLAASATPLFDTGESREVEVDGTTVTEVRFQVIPSVVEPVVGDEVILIGCR